ncbi:transporter substrate-binding protein, partial [Klebsiella pneumoniae]
LARELISKAGGEVLGERYLPLEETAVERIILDIEQRRPSFVLNNLIGPASYAFLRAFKALGDRDSAFLPENCPVVSCDLSE